jgi:hypothetical protein
LVGLNSKAVNDVLIKSGERPIRWKMAKVVRWKRGKVVAATLGVVTYLFAFGFAVYDRGPISHWLSRHLPL